LEELQAEVVAGINARYQEQEVEVLVEADHKGKWKGRTRTNKLVFFEDPGTDWAARQARVTITHTSPWSLQAKLQPALIPLPASIPLPVV